jgi:acyl dehydratase
VWLIVCGCTSRCASIDGLVATKKLFVLHTPLNFTDVVSFLKQTAFSPEIREKCILQIGANATVVKTITASDIAERAELSNNFEFYQAAVPFAAHLGKLAVHGLLAGSPGSSCGMQSPGDGPILLDEHLHFIHPVFVGDKITVSITLKKIKEMKRFYVCTLSVCCNNQRGDVVVKGIYHQMMMKNLFTL